MSFRATLELAHLISRLMEVFDKHKEIPEVQSMLDSLEDGDGKGAADMLDRLLEDYRRMEDSDLIETLVCGYDEPWVGPCKNPRPCVKHLDKRCAVCDERAVRGCDAASSLVCGIPTCAKHRCPSHGR